MLSQRTDHTFGGSRIGGGVVKDKLRLPFLLLCCVAASLAWYWLKPARVMGQARLSRIEAERLSSRNPLAPKVVTYEERLRKVGVSNTVVSQRGVAAWRSDGSTSDLQRFHSMDNRYMYSVRDIRMFPNIEVSVRDEVGLYSNREAQVLTPGKNAERLNPEVSCVANFFGDTQFVKNGEQDSILGYRVVRLSPIGEKGSVRNEYLFASSLGCLKLRRFTEFLGNDGTVTDTSEWIATRVDLMEPDPTLFTIPKDFRFALPSEALKSDLGRLGIKIPEAEMHAIRLNDGPYNGPPPKIDPLLAK